MKTIGAYSLLIAGLLSCSSDHRTTHDDVVLGPETNQVNVDAFIRAFESSLCRRVGLPGRATRVCLTEHAERVKRQILVGGHYIGLLEHEQNALVQTLGADLARRIWYLDRQDVDRSGTVTPTQAAICDSFQFLQIRDSSYVDFLRRESPSLGFQIVAYLNRLEATGEISPSMIIDFLDHYRRLDLTDKRIRFIVAVHYLTLDNHSLSYVNAYTRLRKREQIEL